MRKPLHRLEQGPNQTLSLASVRAELTKRTKPKHFSAFSFEAFATASFQDIMEEDGVAEAEEDAEIIDHAVSQITLRTTLVTQMTTEVRKESASALAAAHAEMGRTAPAPARQRASVLDETEAAPVAQLGSPQEHDADRAVAESLTARWRASLDRLQRAVQGDEEHRVALRLERFCRPAADEASSARRRAQSTKRAQRQSLSAAVGAVILPRATGGGGSAHRLAHWEAAWEAACGASAAEEGEQSACTPNRYEEECYRRRHEGGSSASHDAVASCWMLLPFPAPPVSADDELAWQLASLPATDDPAQPQPSRPVLIAAPPPAAASTAASDALAAAAPRPAPEGGVKVAATATTAHREYPTRPSAPEVPSVAPTADQRAARAASPAFDADAMPSDGFENDNAAWAGPSAAEEEWDTEASSAPDGDAAAAARAAEEASAAAGRASGVAPAAPSAGDISEDSDFEEPRIGSALLPAALGAARQPCNQSRRHRALRRRVVSSDDEEEDGGDDNDAAGAVGPGAPAREGAAEMEAALPHGGVGAASKRADDRSEFGQFDDLDDEALTAALDEAEGTRPRQATAAAAAHLLSAERRAGPAPGTSQGRNGGDGGLGPHSALLLDLRVSRPAPAADGGSGGKGGAKPRPFGLKKSEQDTLLVPGAAPPAHKKRTAQPHPLVSCLVVGPKGELSFALPAAAAELRDRSAMFRSLLSREGDALEWLELRRHTKRWNQSVPLTLSDEPMEAAAAVWGGGVDLGGGEIDSAAAEGGGGGGEADAACWDEWGSAADWGGGEQWSDTDAQRGGGDGGDNEACGDDEGAMAAARGAAGAGAGVEAERGAVRDEAAEVMEVDDADEDEVEQPLARGSCSDDDEGADVGLARESACSASAGEYADDGCPPFVPPAGPPPSRGAPLPLLGQFVAGCVAGGAAKLSDVLSAAGASSGAASAARDACGVDAEAPSAQRVFLALLWVASQHSAAAAAGRKSALPLPAGRELVLSTLVDGDVEIRLN